MSAPTRSLVLVVDDWPVRAAGFVETDRPVAVWSSRGILATNAAARAMGVRIGLRRREAQGRCPELHLVAHDPARDARVFEPVVAALARLTPQVEVVTPGVGAVATRGPARYFGGDDALSRRAADEVGAVLGTPEAVRVGVADGPLAAQLAALSAGPGRCRVVPPGDTRAFVAPIRLRTLARFAPDPQLPVTLDRLGLDTLGDLAALPEAAVAGRFGPDGLWLYRLACGADPRELHLAAIPEDIDEVVDLDPPELRADAVAFAARAAAGRFVARLADRGLSCAQVVITLSTDHAEEHRRRWRLDGPSRPNDASRSPAVAIAERTRWQLDGWLSSPAGTRPSAGVIRVILAPGAIEAARGTQLGFWGGVSAADERAARAVARLEALVGPDAVRVVEARGGRHPDSAATLVPAATTGLDPTRTLALPRAGAGAVIDAPPGRVDCPHRHRSWSMRRPVRSTWSTPRATPWR